MLDQCLTFRTIFGEKHKAGKILFQERAININNLSFPKHNDIGKEHAMMESHCEMETRRDEKRASNSEVDLNRMAQ